jgi:hypothetical protein
VSNHHQAIRALVEASLLTASRTGKRTTKESVRKERNQLLLMFTTRHIPPDGFNTTMLLNELSTSVWLTVDSVSRDVFQEIFKIVPPEEFSKQGMTPQNYLFFRLARLWLEGYCDGRLETKAEYVARQTSGGKTITLRKMGSHFVQDNIRPAEPSDFDPVLPHFEKLYEVQTKNKTPHEQLMMGIDIVFKKSTSPQKSLEEANAFLESVR